MPTTSVHPTACKTLAPVNARRLRFLVPFKSLQVASSRMHCALRRPGSLQTRAVANINQSKIGMAKSTPANTQLPRTPGQPYMNDLTFGDSITDTGKPGKEVVVVGGGWAGKRFLFLSAHHWLV